MTAAAKMVRRPKAEPEKLLTDRVTGVVLVITLLASIGGIYLVHRDGEKALNQAHADT